MAARKKAKKKAVRKKSGTPPFKPTARDRAMVLEMIKLDLSNGAIASLITNPRTGKGISAPTLVSNFKAELGDSRPSGKPRFKPDDRQRQQVMAMQGMGLTHEEIASIITNPKTNKGIDRLTLREHFAPEIAQGFALMKFGVLGRLYTTARSADHPGATTAAIFLAKTKYGYSERHVVEITEGTGVLVPPREMSIDVWIDGEEKKNATKIAPVEDVA